MSEWISVDRRVAYCTGKDADPGFGRIGKENAVKLNDNSASRYFAELRDVLLGI